MKHDRESPTNYKITRKGISCQCSVWTIECNKQYHQ